MSVYEKLSLLISLLAAAISAFSYVRTRNIAAKQLELQHATAELSRKQLELIEQEEEVRSKACVDVELEKNGSDYWFVITNHGDSEARNIGFYLDGDENYNPLVPSEYEQKIPISSLKPGKSVTLIAAITFSSPKQFEAFVRWINLDGSQSKESYLISI